MEDYLVDGMGTRRCGWCSSDPLYTAYHDDEWGRKAFGDAAQFEFLTLESAQAGLSWITILKKREAYRLAYAGFNPDAVSRFGESDINRLMADEGIVRNRRKIEASITNAALFLEISREYGSFAAWLLDFFGGQPKTNHWETLADIPASTPESEAIARQARSRGFRFFGPVIVYAHLQATGIVNDHLALCSTARWD